MNSSKGSVSALKQMKMLPRQTSMRIGCRRHADRSNPSLSFM